MRSTLALYLLITSAAAQLFAHHDHTHHKAAMDPFDPAPPTDASEVDRPALPDDDASPAIQTTSAASRDSEQDFLHGLFGGTTTTTVDARPTADPLASLQIPSTPEDTTMLDPATLGMLDTTTAVPGDTLVALTRSRMRASRTVLAPTTSAATSASDSVSTQTPKATDLSSADQDESTSKLSTLARAGITLGVFAGVALLVALMRWRRRLARALRSREEDLSWAADVEKYDGIAWPPPEHEKPATHRDAARPMTVLAAAPSAELRLWEKLQHNAVQAGWHAPRPGDIVRQSRMLLRSDTWASIGKPPAGPPLTELPPARKNTLTRATRNPTVMPVAGRRNEPELEEGVLRMLTR